MVRLYRLMRRDSTDLRGEEGIVEMEETKEERM